VAQCKGKQRLFQLWPQGGRGRQPPAPSSGSIDPMEDSILRPIS
jgi:hypothetical protein